MARTLENQLHSQHADFLKTMESKDRYIAELQEKRTKEEVEETRELYKVES